MLAAGDAQPAEAPLPQPPARVPPAAVPCPGPDRLPHLPRRLVVKNHGRLRKPRKPRRPAALDLPPSPEATQVDVEVISTPPSPEPLSPVAVRRLDEPKAAPFFRPRPELLALGGAVALALLAVWREGTVAAFTIASLSLLWIESASRRRRPPAELPDPRGRAPASPIGEVEEAPRSFSCSDSDKGSESPSPRTDGGDDPATPKRKLRRSLRKIISRTLQKKPKAKGASGSSDGEVEQPDDPVGGDAEPVSSEAFLSPSSTEETPWEPSTESSPSSVEMKMKTEMEARRGRFPLAAFVPVILAGLALGKLPATALAVLCVAFFGAVHRPSSVDSQ